MESLKKSKKKKGFSATLKNKKTNFWLVWRQERPGISSTKEIEIFINKIRWDANVHIIEYQMYRETLMISSFLYFIWKNHCQKQDSFRN